MVLGLKIALNTLKKVTCWEKGHCGRPLGLPSPPHTPMLLDIEPLKTMSVFLFYFVGASAERCITSSTQASNISKDITRSDRKR